MRRREFFGVVGGAAAAWPLVARAQRAMPVVGFLHPGSSGLLSQLIGTFRDGLKTQGYVEGQNVAIEYSLADGQFERMPALAEEMVRRRVSVIVVSSNPGALAAKQATSTIPIVFAVGSDPIKLGLVASLNRPVSNITGIYFFTTSLQAKRLGILHEMVPKATTLAALVNPNYAGAENQARDVQEAAASLGVQVVVWGANSDNEIGEAFTILTRKRVGALLVCTSPFFNSRREQFVVLAARHALPTIYEFREFAYAGGLMSYGTNLADVFRQVGVYAGRILSGDKPADLPVVQSTKFELVINLSTAKALGLEVPGNLSASADEVIE